jgi:hypothetical protein
MKEEEKEMEAAKEDAPKEIEAEAVAENAPIAEEVAEDTATQMLTNKKSLMGRRKRKTKSRFSYVNAKKKAEEDLVTMSKQTSSIY